MKCTVGLSIDAGRTTLTSGGDEGCETARGEGSIDEKLSSCDIQGAIGESGVKRASPFSDETGDSAPLSGLGVTGTLMTLAIGTITVTSAGSSLTWPTVVMPYVTAAGEVSGSAIITPCITTAGVAVVSRHVKGSSLDRAAKVLASWAAKSFADMITPVGAALSLSSASFL